MPLAPTDNLETIVNSARMRLNDMIVSVGGDIVTDNAVFTPTIVNTAWRKQQDKLSSLGFPVLTGEVVFEGLPSGLSDSASQTFLDWTGFFDGSALHAAFALPQYMIEPIRLDERIAASGDFLQMDKLTRGLPLITKSAWNKFWEWRSGAGGAGSGAIWMPGTTGTWDVRIRASIYLPDFVPAATTPFISQPVPIVRCEDSFSLYMVAEVCAARGDLDTKTIKSEADAATATLVGQGNPGGVSSPALTPPPPVTGGVTSQ